MLVNSLMEMTFTFGGAAEAAKSVSGYRARYRRSGSPAPFKLLRLQPPASEIVAGSSIAQPLQKPSAAVVNAITSPAPGHRVGCVNVRAHRHAFGGSMGRPRDAEVGGTVQNDGSHTSTGGAAPHPASYCPSLPVQRCHGCVSPGLLGSGCGNPPSSTTAEALGVHRGHARAVAVERHREVMRVRFFTAAASVSSRPTTGTGSCTALPAAAAACSETKLKDSDTVAEAFSARGEAAHGRARPSAWRARLVRRRLHRVVSSAGVRRTCRRADVSNLPARGAPPRPPAAAAARRPRGDRRQGFYRGGGATHRAPAAAAVVLVAAAAPLLFPEPRCAERDVRVDDTTRGLTVTALAAEAMALSRVVAFRARVSLRRRRRRRVGGVGDGRRQPPREMAPDRAAIAPWRLPPRLGIARQIS